MKTQYIKPEIHMVLLENMLMASNSISWTVNKANNVNDPDGDDHGHIFGPFLLTSKTDRKDGFSTYLNQYGQGS